MRLITILTNQHKHRRRMGGGAKGAKATANNVPTMIVPVIHIVNRTAKR